ncbi:MAG: putative two-component response regulator [Rhodospirillaceae bacterium]|nr:MAG: putative two-component response regulator [Rhodospirillaceae bacterium]
MGRVAYAVDGVNGLAQVEAFRPDLVILDVCMPKMDGFEMCRRLRRHHAQEDLPVLIQTAFDNETSRTDVFLAGATDMVSKPVVPVELMARIRIYPGKLFIIHNLLAYRERVAQELANARAMQHAMLPQATRIQALASQYNMQISSHFEASSELGEDIWDIVAFSEGRLGLYVADFSGYGVTAALNTFRLHTLVRQIPPLPDDPGAWLTAMNVCLKGLLPAGQFATILYAVVDTRSGTFHYTSAGGGDQPSSGDRR